MGREQERRYTGAELLLVHVVVPWSEQSVCDPRRHCFSSLTVSYCPQLSDLLGKSSIDNPLADMTLSRCRTSDHAYAATSLPLALTQWPFLDANRCERAMKPIAVSQQRRLAQVQNFRPPSLILPLNMRRCTSTISAQALAFRVQHR